MTTPTWSPLLLNMLPSTTDLLSRGAPAPSCACWALIASQLAGSNYFLFAFSQAFPVTRLADIPDRSHTAEPFPCREVFHREAVSLDGPPTFRRPMRPLLDRHHLIGFVGVVVGHLFALSVSNRQIRRAFCPR